MASAREMVVSSHNLRISDLVQLTGWTARDGRWDVRCSDARIVEPDTSLDNG
jgi:hypothetical protein